MRPEASRRAVLAGAALAALGGGCAFRRFQRDRDAALRRVTGRSTIIDTRFGDLEYAEAGAGPPVLMIHGAGGGFDQGLTFGEGLLARGLRVIAPSRFGYLRSAFPERPTAENQADAFADLLDHLGLAQAAVVGGSAGAGPAAAFALRHAERCSALVLLVPAMNLEGRDPVEMSPLTQWGVRRLLGSDFLFWTASKVAPDALTRQVLATDPALLETVSDAERRRARHTLETLMPISRRTRGLLNDARRAGEPADLDLAAIRAPTLTLSVEDDRFNTAGTARRIAATVPGARLRLYPTGGHLWLGHDREVADEIAGFLKANPV